MSAELPPPDEIVLAVQEALVLLQRYKLEKALSGTGLVTLTAIAHLDPADFR